MGTVDKTLFLLKHGNDLLIVQIYVDDIIFGGSSHDLVAKFADDMSREFEMSMMGELQFFLRLQIQQVKDGTFVHQGKYTKDMLKKFGMNDSKPLSTPMSTTAVMDADEEGEPVDQKEYRSMIDSLLYLTVTRPDMQFSMSLCAHFQLLQGLHIGKRSSRFSGICSTLLTWVFGFLPPRHSACSDTLMLTLLGVAWIASPLLGRVSFLVLLWSLGHPASNRV